MNRFQRNLHFLTIKLGYSEIRERILLEGRTGSARIIDEEAPLVRNKVAEKRLREILHNYYDVISSGSAKEHELKGRVNGYSEALLSLGQIDRTALKKIFEEEHFQAFQMTKEARQGAVVGSTESWSERDWGKLDEPTYLRRPLRCKRK